MSDKFKGFRQTPFVGKDEDSIEICSSHYFVPPLSKKGWAALAALEQVTAASTESERTRRSVAHQTSGRSDREVMEHNYPNVYSTDLGFQRPAKDAVQSSRWLLDPAAVTRRIPYLGTLGDSDLSRRHKIATLSKDLVERKSTESLIGKKKRLSKTRVKSRFV